MLQNAINAVFNWSRHWELPLSEEKTKVLHIGGKNLKAVYRIGSCDIVSVDKIRDLGFLINSKLCFDQHCDEVAAKACSAMYKLFRSLMSKDSSIFTFA